MARSLRIELPWPPSALSPNGSHGHWSSRARAKKSYRDACCITTLEATRGLPAVAGELAVALEFRPPPDGRRRDRDNLVARMKAGLDGVAQALRIDDSAFVELRARIGDPAPSRLLARVRVEIRGIEQEDQSNGRR